MLSGPPLIKSPFLDRFKITEVAHLEHATVSREDNLVQFIRGMRNDFAGVARSFSERTMSAVKGISVRELSKPPINVTWEGGRTNYLPIYPLYASNGHNA